MEYYKKLAELREFELDTILKRSKEVLIINGVVYSMLLEVESYGLKSGKNQKYRDSVDRIFKIQTFIDSNSQVNEHNYNLRSQLKESMIERDLLMQENIKLKKEIEGINKAFESQ